MVNTAAHAAQIVVTNPNDSGPGSLRQAIADALPGDEVVFAQGVSTITLTTGELVIDKDLTITGLGAVTISGNNSSRVFRIDSGIVTLSGLTITDGFLFTLSVDDGSCIKNEGMLTIDNCTISDNWLGLLGGSGGIANFGTLTVNNSMFSGNWAQYGGGGIFIKGTLTFDNSTFSDNATEFDGSGIKNEGTLTVNNSKFSGNYAEHFGGGIGNGGTLTVDNSTFSDNRVGSGVDDSSGGGIYNFFDSVLTVNNSTFSGNSTFTSSNLPDGGSGGGIFNDGTLTVNNSTFSGNFTVSEFSAGFGTYGISNTGALTIKNSIVANGLSGSNCDFSGTETVLGANFSTDDTCDGFTHTQVLPEDLKLDPLKNNGGPTETHALLSSSVAIDAATDCTLADGTPVATDQRGVSRPQRVDCDAGAFEAGVLINDSLNLDNVATSYNTTPVSNALAGVFTISATFTNISSSDLSNIFFEVAKLTGGNLLLNADGGSGGEGYTLSIPPDALGTNGVLDPGESFTVGFEIGLAVLAPFEFFVDVEGIRP